MPDEIDREKLRSRITAARGTAGLNQAKLAELAGITPSAISQIEKGDRIPSLPVLKRIAQTLNVSVNYLMGETDESEIEDILQNGEVKQFFRDYESLSVNDKEQVAMMIELLKKKKNAASQ